MVSCSPKKSTDTEMSSLVNGELASVSASIHATAELCETVKEKPRLTADLSKMLLKILESVFPLSGKRQGVDHVSRVKGSRDMSRDSKNSKERASRAPKIRTCRYGEQTS